MHKNNLKNGFKMNKVYIIDINNLKKSFSYEEIYNKVSLYRKNKTDRLVFEKDKWLSLGAEYLLIQALNDLEIDYSKIDIDLAENKKPILKNIENVFFNLSHSKDMAMCAISNKEIGCDIQAKSDNSLEIADRFFNKEEVDLIGQKETLEEKKDLFYRLWTLKESYSKALGLGLNIGLAEFQIQLTNDNISVSTKQNLDTDFYFEEIKLKNKEYKCAICSKCFDKCEIKEIML